MSGPDPTNTDEKTRFVLDRDGDLWQRIPEPPGLWRCLTTESCETAGRDLVNVCGPLRKLGVVDEVEARTRQHIADEIERRAEFWGHPGSLAIADAARIARGGSDA